MWEKHISSTNLISDTEKYVWYAKVNENGFPSLFVFLIRDVSIRSPPGPKAILRRNSKLQTNRKAYNSRRKHNISNSKYEIKRSKLNKVVKINLDNILNNFYKYLWGQIFVSSSEGLRIKSTKALLRVFVGKGGGSSSMAQNRFLANPCWSRVPRPPNWKQRANFLIMSSGMRW